MSKKHKLVQAKNLPKQSLNYYIVEYKMRKNLMLTNSDIWVKEIKWRCGYSIECCINMCARLMLVERDRNLIVVMPVILIFL